VVIFLLPAIAPHAFAQPGTLDSSFGVNGKVFTSMNSYPNDLALQTDGKIVVAGSDGDSTVHLIRYQTTGGPDSSFGINGKVSTDVRANDNLGYVGAVKVEIQQDGKIVVASDYRLNDGSMNYFVLLRYLSSGNPDPDFGINGQIFTPIGGFETVFTSLAIQADGKILAGGFEDGFYLMRYKMNGKIDSSFGKNGIVWYHNDDDIFGVIIDVLPLDNGKIIVESTKTFFNNDTVAVERLSAKGVRDSSFGINGLVFTSFRGFFYGSLALYNNDIIVSGDLNGKIGISKIKNPGVIDVSFGLNGMVEQINGHSNKLLIQSNGKIITAGNVLARFTPAGIIDSSFGVNGQANNFSLERGSALQQDGKIVTLSDPAFTVYRFKGDPDTINIKKNISVIEGNSGYTTAQFKVVLNHASASTVKVDYTTKNGSALAGSDYTSTSGTLTFKPGKVLKNITINVIGDNTYESNEKFSLVLGNPVNAVLGALDSAVCTVKNDDPLSPELLNQNVSINGSGVKLYPNPVKNELNIDGLNSSRTTLSVIDMEGKILLKTFANNETRTISVKKLSAGVYYLRIEADQKITVLKFIKE